MSKFIRVCSSIFALFILNLKSQSRREDLVLAMGAGDVNGLWNRLAA